MVRSLRLVDDEHVDAPEALLEARELARILRFSEGPHRRQPDQQPREKRHRDSDRRPIMAALRPK